MHFRLITKNFIMKVFYIFHISSICLRNILVFRLFITSNEVEISTLSNFKVYNVWLILTSYNSSNGRSVHHWKKKIRQHEPFHIKIFHTSLGVSTGAFSSDNFFEWLSSYLISENVLSNNGLLTIIIARQNCCHAWLSISRKILSHFQKRPKRQ